MIRAFKEKQSANVQFNFNNSPEISYWSKKLNVDPGHLQRIFEELGFSISRTIDYFSKGNSFSANLHP